MSLIAELRNRYSPLSQLFANEFSTRTFVRDLNKGIGKPRFAFACPKTSPLIGTALDYRIRFHLCKDWIEDSVAHRIADDPQRSSSSIRLGAHRYFYLLQNNLRRLCPYRRRLSRNQEIELVRHCLILGRMEQWWRSGFLTTTTNFDEPADFMVWRYLLNGIHKRKTGVPSISAVAGKEVSALFGALRDCQPFRRWSKSNVVTNIIFPLAYAVGGADGDLFVGPTLVDIKSSAQGLHSQDLFQILSYALLRGIRVSDLEVGFLMPRFLTYRSWRHKELFGLLQPRCSYSVFVSKFYSACFDMYTRRIAANLSKKNKKMETLSCLARGRPAPCVLPPIFQGTTGPTLDEALCEVAKTWRKWWSWRPTSDAAVARDLKHQ